MTKKHTFDTGTRFGDLYDALQNTPPVERIERLSFQPDSALFQQFAKKSCPFIYRINTPIEEDTILKSMLKNFRDKEVKVRLGDYANPVNYAPKNRILQDLSLGSYFEEISSPSNKETPPYAGNFTLPIDFLSSIGAQIPEFYDRSVFEAPTVWLGAPGCITPLHRDSSDNFAIHLCGKKKWVIFSPLDAPFLYMTSVKESKGGDFATSSIDLRNPDLTQYPLFAKARPFTIELNAGEVLYLPMGWSHYVENIQMSLMVNHWLSIEPIGVEFLLKK